MMRLFIASLSVWILVGTQAGAQNQMVDKVNLVDRSNSKYIQLNKPSSLSSGLKLIFPASAGAADQVLAISGIAASDVTLGWVTMSAGSSTTSDRLTATQTVTPPTEPTGLVIAADANKIYRVVATIRGSRNTGTGGSDLIMFKLSGPAGSTFVSLGVRCIDKAGITPSFASAATDNVTSSAIDPPDYGDYTYSIDGLVIVGGTSGNVTLKMIDGASPATTNTLEMLQHSNMVLREIE